MKFIFFAIERVWFSFHILSTMVVGLILLPVFVCVTFVWDFKVKVPLEMIPSKKDIKRCFLFKWSHSNAFEYFLK